MAMDIIVTKYAVAMVTTTTINHACRRLHLGFEVNLMYNVHMIVMSYMSSVPMHDWCLPWRNHGLQWRIMASAIGIEVTIQH